MFSSDLDDIDIKILNILQDDAKISYAEMGRKLNMSRSAVRERVNILIEKGIIEKFTIVINPYKLGLEMSAFFEIDVEPRHLQTVAKTLAEEKYVQSVNQMSGPSTLHVHAILKNKEHLERFLSETIYSLNGITSVRSYILIRGFKSKSGGLRIC
ncbi:Lrp/AsnC family transcriptional regulator [Thermoanaerobacteraceae bacterium SP2]|nr:Lrp/AsnC family transcriptional regulator [Thermoanaerobacteraceae bacterium SP2]